MRYLVVLLILLLLPVVGLADEAEDVGVGMGFIMMAMYFIPALVAHGRGHKNKVAITWLNFLSGWTGLGWLIAFIWSLTNDE